MRLLIATGLKDTKHERQTPETKNENTKKINANFTTQWLSSNTRRIRKKGSQYLRTPSYYTMSNLYYQSCDRKYPDDPGNHPINDNDVVQPENHLWEPRRKPNMEKD
jgi:hypothetical protein